MNQRRRIHKRDVFVLVVTLFLFWILLTVDFSASSLLLGFLISLLVGLATTRLTIATIEGKRKNIKEYIFATEHLIGLIVSALIRIIIANIELIYQVITLRINPRIVRIKLDLSSDAELALISHLITVTPGTLVIDVEDAPDEGSYLFVHFSALTDQETSDSIEKSIGKWHDMIGALFR
jgi:multicomponent Na+:H+ antiporter subunit E